MAFKRSRPIYLDQWRYLTASVKDGMITIAKRDGYEDEGWKNEPEITMSLTQLKQLLDDLK